VCARWCACYTQYRLDVKVRHREHNDARRQRSSDRLLRRPWVIYLAIAATPERCFYIVVSRLRGRAETAKHRAVIVRRGVYPPEAGQQFEQ
jgi:hypothetical protein